MNRCRALATLLFDPHRTPGSAYWGIDRGVMTDIERARWRRAVGGRSAGTMFAPVSR